MKRTTTAMDREGLLDSLCDQLQKADPVATTSVMELSPEDREVLKRLAAKRLKEGNGPPPIAEVFEDGGLMACFGRTQPNDS